MAELVRTEDRNVRAFSSTIHLVGSALKTLSGSSGSQLVEVEPDSVSFAAVTKLSEKLGVSATSLLNVIGIPERTRTRRRQEGFLKADEADRLLRVARIFEEAVRVFGTEEKAAAWLRTVSPFLYGVAPFTLLDSDAGAQAVSEELVRIDFGDFA
jgi:putative toxin-antitoxin system antitoxin component (TIGR02293 family)